MKSRAICAVSLGSLQIGVYGIGAGPDRAMYYKGWNGNAWLPSLVDWLSLDGQAFDRTPSALVSGQVFTSNSDVFGVGIDSQMHHRNVQGTWPPAPEAWQALGTVTGSALDFTSSGFYALDVTTFGSPNTSFAIVGLGKYNQPYLKVFDGKSGAWLPSIAGWLPLGGLLICNPAVVPDDPLATPNNFSIFGVGTGRQMFRMTLDGSQWPPKMSGWLSLGGCFTSAPAVVKWASNRIDIFGLDDNRSMLHGAWENGGWSGWEALGGTFDSEPAAVSWAPNRLDIFALGTHDQMFHKWWDGGSWNPPQMDWKPLGGVFNSAPAVVSTGPNRLDIFGLGTNNALMHKAWSGGPDWNPPQTNWENLGGVFLVTEPTKMPSQLDFDWPVNFSDGTAITGSLHVTLFSDGTSRFSGRLHDSGGLSYSCSTGFAIIDGKNRAYTFEDFGDVWGTDLPGSRDHNWSVPTPANSILRDNWSDMFPCGGPKFGARVDTQTFPPGGLLHNVINVLNGLSGGTPLTVIPLVGSGP
jgi:Repeat of unknown function (DUF346)